jgi:hypothetical protein
MVHRMPIPAKLFGFLFAAVASLPALAQSDRGAISGTVIDQNGGAVRRAKVTVVNLDSGASREVATTDDGAFVVPELRAAPYRLTVEAAGFKTMTLDRLQIAVQVTRRVDIRLEVGALGEVTTVTAAAGALQTEGPVLQTNITERQVRELPLQIGAESGGRSPLSFIFLDSSVSSGGALADQGTAASRGAVGFNFRVNGGQGLGTEILIDGAATRRAENGTFFSEVAPGPNAFQEFTISTAQYSAEYGNSSGGVVNFTIKSGGNDFHGELYENLRNEALNANSDFNRLRGLPRPLDRQHDFGVSIGGPIYLPHFGEGGPAVKGFRNRAFFFFNYGGYRLSQFETVDVSVPTLKMRSGDFSELLTDPYVTNFFGGPLRIFDNTTACCIRTAIPGNRLDLYRNAAGNSIIDPAGFNIINSLFPAPNRDGVYHNFRTTTGAPATTNYYVQKLDFNLSEKHRLSFSSSYRKLNSIKGFPRFPEPWVAQGVWKQEFRSQYYRLQEDFTIRPNLLNHFNAGFSRSFVQNRNFTRGMDPRTLGLPGNATQNLGLPLIGFPLHGDPVTSLDPRAYQPGGSTFFDNQDGDNAVQFTDFVAWSRGRHTLKFGAETRWQQLNDSNHFDIGGNFNFIENQTSNGPGTGGWPVASLITGAPEFSFATVQSIDPGFRFFEPTFFVQDDIKVTPKLTVNVGVRYDIPYPRVEARDRYRGFNPTAMNPVVGRPGAIVGVAGEGGVKSKYRGLVKPDYTDVSPRFGFAYRVNEKTVVRGGYGLYYAPLLYNEFGRGGLAGYAIQGGANINFGFDAIIRFNNYPALPAVDPTTQLVDTVVIRDVEGFNENFKNGRTAQYSLDIQRELPGRMALSVSYIGSKGTRLRSNFSPPNALPFNALKLGAPLLRTPFIDVTPAQRAYAQSVGVPLPANNAAVFAGFSGTVAQALRPFPHYGRITEHLESEGQSSYNALKVDLQRRFGQGLHLGVSYTFAKLLTDAAEDLFGATPISGVVQNPYDRESLWSPSTNVVPHSFVANYLYELPFGKNKPFLNRGKAFDAIFGGWQFTGVLRYRQGPGLVPLIAGRSRDFLDLIGFTGNLRPNVTGQPFYTGNQPGGVQYAYLNPAAFSRPQDFEPLSANGNPLFGAADVGSAAYAAYYANPLRFFGNAAPSYSDLRGRPFFNEDFSIAKKTRLNERITVELRADIFNAFNRGRFLLPDMNFDNPFTFGISGRAPNSFQPRAIQIVGRLIF